MNEFKSELNSICSICKKPSKFNIRRGGSNHASCKLKEKSKRQPKIGWIKWSKIEKEFGKIK